MQNYADQWPGGGCNDGMKRKGPVITLAAGVVVASVLMVLNLNTTGGQDYDPAAAEPNAPAATTTAADPAATTQPAKPPATGPVTYAGNVQGGAATLAIAIKDGTAVAYVCDGKKAEAWLQGTAAGGELSLTGPGEAKLTGTYGNGKAAGQVWAAGKKWAFSLASVKPPSGLYRAAADVNGARVVGGWIVLADGTQVGVVSVDGVEQPASPLNPATGASDVNGSPVTAAPVDGAPLT